MPKKEPIHGLFAVNKPSGKAIKQVLQHINHTFRLHAERTRPEMTRRQVVSLGTCFTQAKFWSSGVCVIGVNQGCRYLKSQDKMNERYHATGILGFSTNTKDIGGEVVDTASSSHITRQQILSILPTFQGKIYQEEFKIPETQPIVGPPFVKDFAFLSKRQKKKIINQKYRTPPTTPTTPRVEIQSPKSIYSVKLLEFTRVHKYKPPILINTLKPTDVLNFDFDHSQTSETSKTSETSEISEKDMLNTLKFPDQPTPISISLNNLINLLGKSDNHPIFKIDVECSSDAPIGRLIDDIGHKLGSVAFLTELERVKQGDFELYKDTLEWEELERFDNIYNALNDWIRKVRNKELELG
ncbi:tRNA pseudouridine55 synthase [Gigaspora margarita]|uniref:tRNA pseudouridine(55) synthase n=1 Tax=Gigaspora margarita TaxID=4874 RepID=A0A8H3X0G2_GIGMA|nr:tRNA pseudouridine55 synthase [Gigaspora margarita]